MPAKIPSQQSLGDWQEYIARKIEERGFADETLQDNFMLLVEEVGELAKSLRPLHGIKTANDSTKKGREEIEHEAADVFWLLVCVCNKLGIDLDAAIRSKEEKNSKRTWQ